MGELCERLCCWCYPCSRGCARDHPGPHRHHWELLERWCQRGGGSGTHSTQSSPHPAGVMFVSSLPGLFSWV